MQEKGSNLPKDRPDCVLSRRVAKTETSRNVEEMWKMCVPEHSKQQVAGIPHIWISIICAPSTLYDPAGRELSLSCNVTPRRADGYAL